MKKVPRVIIVGGSSGSGKTTVFCGILKNLINKKYNVATFKVGPDYIDPKFHKFINKKNSKNLDIYMFGEETTKYIFEKNSQNCDIALIEGVMGMYDGLSMTNQSCSSNHVSEILKAPEILILDGKATGYSILAQIHGYLTFKKNNIKGVIINNISEKIFSTLKNEIESLFKIKALGYFPKNNEVRIESRHLGLKSIEEIEDINKRIKIISDTIKNTVNIEELVKIAYSAEDYDFKTDFSVQHKKYNLNIGIALDKAFNFYYSDNFELMEELGCKLTFFSPLNDKTLPKDIDALYFGGGYPEVYAKQLSENKSMTENIKNEIIKGLPVYAECGGYIYLTKSILFENKKYDMVGVIDSDSFMTKKLSRFGYIELEALEDNILCKKSEKIKAHEFHYCDTSFNGDSFTAKKESGVSWNCIHAKNNVFAGFQHINFYSNINFLVNFLNYISENKNYTLLE